MGQIEELKEQLKLVKYDYMILASDYTKLLKENQELKLRINQKG